MTNHTDAALNDLSAHMRKERDALNSMVAALGGLHWEHGDPLTSERFTAYRRKSIPCETYVRLDWRAVKAWKEQFMPISDSEKDNLSGHMRAASAKKYLGRVINT